MDSYPDILGVLFAASCQSLLFLWLIAEILALFNEMKLFAPSAYLDVLLKLDLVLALRDREPSFSLFLEREACERILYCRYSNKLTTVLRVRGCDRFAPTRRRERLPTLDDTVDEDEKELVFEGSFL